MTNTKGKPIRTERYCTTCKLLAGAKYFCESCGKRTRGRARSGMRDRYEMMTGKTGY